MSNLASYIEFQKNLERIKVNNTNKIIAKKLDNISDEIREISLQLDNNINNGFTGIIREPPAAGHTLPVTNNTHLHFTSTLRRFW